LIRRGARDGGSFSLSRFRFSPGTAGIVVRNKQIDRGIAREPATKPETCR
jgi:hypothetical protein